MILAEISGAKQGCKPLVRSSLAVSALLLSRKHGRSGRNQNGRHGGTADFPGNPEELQALRQRIERSGSTAKSAKRRKGAAMVNGGIPVKKPLAPKPSGTLTI